MRVYVAKGLGEWRNHICSTVRLACDDRLNGEGGVLDVDGHDVQVFRREVSFVARDVIGECGAYRVGPRQSDGVLGVRCSSGKNSGAYQQSGRDA